MKRESMWVTIFLLCISVTYAAAPVVNSAELISTYGFNTIGENITLMLNVTDADNDPIKNITTWYINGTTIAVLNLPFEGGSNASTSTDYSGADHAVTVNGATWNESSGYDGFGSYYFDGSDDISVADSPSFDFGSGDFTIAWWENESATGNHARIARSATTSFSPFLISSFNGDPTVYYYLSSTSASWDIANARTMGSITYGEWSHRALTRNGTRFTSYKNGVQQDTFTTSASLADSSDPLSIGRSQSGTEVMLGYLDDVIIVDYALTQQQLLSIYENGFNQIISGQFGQGDILSVCVAPNDKIQDGSTVCSNNVTLSIIDQAPGNESDVTITGVADLNITIDGSDNLGIGDFNSHMIAFYDGADLIANFSHDFSKSKINFSQVSIVKTSTGVLINLGDQLAAGETKTLYLADNEFSELCVKDAQISALGEISFSCNQVGETKFSSSECQASTTKGNITCTLSGGVFSVSGLSNSGIQGGTPAVPEFSDYALMAALVLTISGFVVIRRKQ